MKKVKPEKIKEIILSNTDRFDAVAVVPLIPLSDAALKVYDSIEKGHVPDSYRWTREKTDYAYRYKNYGAWAKSIILAACSYFTGEEYPEDPLFGRIARYTWRNNYRYIRQELEKTAVLLEKSLGTAVKFKALSNYTSIPEKVIFSCSGTARFGKNSVLLSPGIGSYFAVGELLTDLDVEFGAVPPLKPPDYSVCGGCERCMKACPTRAIKRAGELDINRCFQYISENLVLMPGHLREKWGSRLYGCSECIDACPYNHNLAPRDNMHGIGYVGPGMNLIEAITMGEKKWNRIFSENQIGIREKNAVLKNAITSLGFLKYKKSVTWLLPLLFHQNEIIRAYTSWAVGKLNTKTGKKKLEAVYKDDPSEIVRSEIEPFLR